MLTQVHPSGRRGPTFIANGHVQSWHYGIWFIGSFAFGFGCQALAAHLCQDPSDIAAFLKKLAAEKEAEAAEKAAEAAEDKAREDAEHATASGDDALPMTTRDANHDEHGADEPAGVSLSILESGSSSSTAAIGSQSQSPRRRGHSSKISPRRAASPRSPRT